MWVQQNGQDLDATNKGNYFIASNCKYLDANCTNIDYYLAELTK